ncbi:MAG: orotate phosphoribosyltransferase [Candidatus Eremiobacteraeota bacterium]|nr:orotate phosphoribosyltransferase [Candidatus Eremiobacteraeota bacterium]
MPITSDFDLNSALHERGALLEGHFRLSSGRHSNKFIQKFRILENPPLVEQVGRRIADAFRDAHPTVVVSAAIGGIVLGYEVARQLGTNGIFVEKEGGVAKLRRSFHLTPHDRVLVVEDVVTTGMSVKEVIDVVRSHGAHVIGVGVIVERGAADFGVPTHALLKLPIESYDPAECPQCAAGEPITDPGSRRA